jgi:hypothetical protein
MMSWPIPADREYNLSMAGWMTAYVLLLTGASWAHSHHWLTGPWIYVAAVAPSLPIGGVMVAVLRLLGRSDEFVRAVLIRRFVAATSLMLFGCTAYGFLEIYADLPHAPLYLAFAAFWAAFAVVSPFIRSSR